MKLKDIIQADNADVFFDEDDFAEQREFAIGDQKGGQLIFTAVVLWDTDSMKSGGLVRMGTLYIGDVLLFIRKTDLPGSPKVGQWIASPRSKRYVIQSVIEREDIYEITLSEPGAP